MPSIDRFFYCKKIKHPWRILMCRGYSEEVELSCCKTAENYPATLKKLTNLIGLNLYNLNKSNLVWVGLTKKYQKWGIKYKEVLVISLWSLASKWGSGPLPFIYFSQSATSEFSHWFYSLPTLHLHPHCSISHTNNESLPDDSLHNYFFKGSYVLPKKMNKHGADELHQNP